MRLGALLAASTCGCTPARPSYVVSNPALRSAPVYLYPAEGRARAWLFFFGNDVGFWDAHQRLASRLAGDGIHVVGLDVRPILRALPDGPPTLRAAAFGDTISSLIRASRHELHSDSLPVLIGGHSIGAELAIYTAARMQVPGLIGVLALSPGLRGHLRVSLSDLTMSSEPTEPGSFAVADEICRVPGAVRIAILRGARDKYRYADSAFAVAGGARLARWVIPFSGHSLKGLTVAWPTVTRALDYLLVH